MANLNLAILLGTLVVGLPLLGDTDQRAPFQVAQVPTPIPFPLSTSTPLVITNSQNPFINAAPSWSFQSTSSGCTDTSQCDSLIANFENSDSSSVLIIPCATTGLGSGVQAAGLTVKGGQGIFNIDLPSPIPSPTLIPLPICAAGGAMNTDIAEEDCRGLVAPTYTFTGYPATPTFHCVYGNVVASSTTTTVNLTNSAVFGTAPTEVSGVNVTSGTVVPTTAFTSVGTSSVTFTLTNPHSYYLYLCGF